MSVASTIGDGGVFFLKFAESCWEQSNFKYVSAAVIMMQRAYVSATGWCRVCTKLTGLVCYPFRAWQGFFAGIHRVQGPIPGPWYIPGRGTYSYCFSSRLNASSDQLQ